MPELLSPLNQFMEQIAQGVNKGLTISANLDGVVQTIQVDMSLADPFPVSFRWSRVNRPSVAWIGRAWEVSGTHTTFTDPLFLDWEMTADGSFRVNAIPGLPTGTKYNITIIALAE